jgi:hypothetical protein
LVVQAALFAGFLSAFLIELLRRLEPDPMDIIQDVLIYQTQMMRNSSLGPYVPADFSPPEHIVVVNALFYASLGVMILAAFIAMLVKSWVREFDRGLRGMSIQEQRAKTREFRYLGMERWDLPGIVRVLPLLIQISLLQFSIGLVWFLFHISISSFFVTTAIFGLGILFYAITTFISVVATSSPFHSPVSRDLATLYRQVHDYLFTMIDDFSLRAMGTTGPDTALSRFYRVILIFLHKSRPYSESYFVEPIATTAFDEIQLSTAASALQRIHDNAPDSHHSEALQWSVWEVAGSAAFPIPPLFDLPQWIIDRVSDEEYFSHLPPAKLVALVAVSLRARRKWDVVYITHARDNIRRMETSKDPWLQLVISVSDHLLDHAPVRRDYAKWIHMESRDLTKTIQVKELQLEESLWLLRTLSELRGGRWTPLEEPSFIEICLPVLMNEASRWGGDSYPNIALLGAVVTLAAISCCPDEANQLKTLANSHRCELSLLNIRNHKFISTLFEHTPSNYHRQLTSLLFLVVYALIYMEYHLPGSYPRAVHYFTIITAKGDLTLYTSALTAIAPVMRDPGLSAIGRMLVAPQTQELKSIIDDSMVYQDCTVQEELLNGYDHRLGASDNPDPNIFAILLILSKHLPSDTIEDLQHLNLELKNYWLRLAARVVAQLGIPDGCGLPVGLFHDHRIQNMMAALSLLRYTDKRVTQYTESLLLASFLESREPAISSVALEYYMKTIISYSDPSAPAGYLSTAVSTTFDFISPHHQLLTGWKILDTFVDGVETLSVEWRRAFAEGFFTLWRRPLPRPRGAMVSSTRENELEKILSWEYFHEEERPRELTDSDFSGLDWMAMAWSLHLSQQLGRTSDVSGQGTAQPQDLLAPAVNEEFVLRILCNLLDAAPYDQILPIIPKLREFVQWFDDIDLLEYRTMIAAHIEEAVRRQQGFYMSHKFHKFHCMWYI